MSFSRAISGTPSPRLLRFAASGTVALVFTLLALGAVVTSFRVGMADPVWPTRPWHLLTISWQEPSTGFLIEHTHRAAGFVVGLTVTGLAILLWLTETRRGLRWGGLAAIVALVGLFMGHLHGLLIGQQQAFQATGELWPPNWAALLSPTLIALAVTAVLSVCSAATEPNGACRLLGVILLVAVMAQGVLGGLRVYLNALFGSDLATIHGVFSQIVLAVAVATLVLTGRRRISGSSIDPGLVRCAVLTACVVFAQIVVGAVLRHSDSPVASRLHLLGAFLVVFATAAVARRSRGTGVRGLAVLAASLAGLQVVLGVEAWMIRFKGGFNLSAMQRVTEADAIIRTLHTLVGYGLFATVVGLMVVLLRDHQPKQRVSTARRSGALAEALV